MTCCLRPSSPTDRLSDATTREGKAHAAAAARGTLSSTMASDRDQAVRVAPRLRVAESFRARTRRSRYTAAWRHETGPARRRRTNLNARQYEPGLANRQLGGLSYRRPCVPEEPDVSAHPQRPGNN